MAFLLKSWAVRGSAAFFARPVMSLAALAKTLGVAYNTALTAVTTLERYGVLRPLGEGRGRVYIRGPVYDLLFHS